MPSCFDSLVSRMPISLRMQGRLSALSHTITCLPDFQGPGSSVVLLLLVVLHGITELPGVSIPEVTFSSLFLAVSHPLILSQSFSALTCQSANRTRHWSPVPSNPSSPPVPPTPNLRSSGLTSLQGHFPSKCNKYLERLGRGWYLISLPPCSP